MVEYNTFIWSGKLFLCTGHCQRHP